MSKPPPFNEQERADLVAYLDGELTGEPARALEAKLSLEPRARAEAESLKRAWELLDFLPRPEPSPDFTSRTLSKLAPVRRTVRRREAAAAVVPVGPWWKVALLASGWAAAALLAGWVSYAGVRALAPGKPGEEELVRELRLIKHKRYYDAVN